MREDEGSAQAWVSEGISARVPEEAPRGNEGCKIAVYRHFDSEGRLLYVGCSQDPAKRLAALKTAGARWIEMIATITVEWYSSRDIALAFEAAAIRAEHPLNNIQHNLPPPATPDRHRPGYKKEYMRTYMRERRAKEKAAKK